MLSKNRSIMLLTKIQTTIQIVDHQLFEDIHILPFKNPSSTFLPTVRRKIRPFFSGGIQPITSPRIIYLVIVTFIIFFLASIVPPNPSSLFPLPDPFRLLQFTPRTCFINLLVLGWPIRPRGVLLDVR